MKNKPIEKTNIEPKRDETQNYIIGFSGGKDSVASWIYLEKELGFKNLTCLFADTGHEEKRDFPKYMQQLKDDFGCPLIRIAPTLLDMKGELKPENIAERIGGDPDDPNFWNQELDMEKLAILKRRFPSSMARFCTTILKLKPSKRWQEENYPDNDFIRVSGVRADESANRARQNDWEFDDFMSSWLWKPIFKWTAEQVFEIHRKHNIPWNPLYEQGSARVGCYPCINSRKSELFHIGKNRPDMFDDLAAMEMRVAKAVGKDAMSFFSNTKTPEKFHSETCENSGKSFPNALDVKAWAMRDEPTQSHQEMMFGFQEDDDEDSDSCSSQYGLCE